LKRKTLTFYSHSHILIKTLICTCSIISISTIHHKPS